jgi:hypothetical protein
MSALPTLTLTLTLTPPITLTCLLSQDYCDPDALLAAAFGGRKVDTAEHAFPAVDAEQAEAILYLATYFKKMGSFQTAEFFCNRSVQCDSNHYLHQP